MDDPDVKTIIMVEPDVVIRMVIAEHLRDCGYRVIEGVTAGDVWSVLDSGRRIDVVLADVAEFLRDSGHRVIEAASVREAIVLLAGDPRVDVIFSDINLPGEDGVVALSDWLDKHRPGIPLLFTSGRTIPPELASKPFVSKPYSLADIEERLNSLLAPHD